MWNNENGPGQMFPDPLPPDVKSIGAERLGVLALVFFCTIGFSGLIVDDIWKAVQILDERLVLAATPKPKGRELPGIAPFLRPSPDMH